MNELTLGVNFTAVFVGFVASYFLGWLWYSPKMFGKKWAEGVGLSLEECGEIPMMAMITQVLGTLGLSWLIGITASSNSFLTALLILVMLMLLIVSNGKYAQKSNVAVSIEAAYIFMMGLIMLACQAVF